jgi:cytochrome c-type biogenesis protein CcmH/NrfF
MHLRNYAHAHLARLGILPLAVTRWAGLGVVAALLLVPVPASGDEAAPAPTAGHAAGMSEAERDRQAEAISRSIMSPFCPGRTVSSCPNAGPWRDDIRKWVGEGVDAAEIKRRLTERMPEHDLAGIPKNRLGWVLPVGLTIGALGLLVFLLRYLVSPRSKEGDVGEAGPGKAGAAAGEKRGALDENPAVDGAAVPPVPNKSGKDWDAQLDRELDTLDN